MDATLNALNDASKLGVGVEEELKEIEVTLKEISGFQGILLLAIQLYYQAH